jgi:hypothetical protein
VNAPSEIALILKVNTKIDISFVLFILSPIKNYYIINITVKKE